MYNPTTTCFGINFFALYGRAEAFNPRPDDRFSGVVFVQSLRFRKSSTIHLRGFGLNLYPTKYIGKKIQKPPQEFTAALEL